MKEVFNNLSTNLEVQDYVDLRMSINNKRA